MSDVIRFPRQRAPKGSGDPTAPFPQSLEAERALLGGLLLDPVQIPEIAQHLKAEHFYSSAHAKLYALLIERERSGCPLDVLGLADHIMTTNQAEEFGGLAYATDLPSQVPTTEKLGYYAGIVRGKATRRAVMDFAAMVRQEALTNPNNAEEVLAAVKAGVEALIAGNDTAQDGDVEIEALADQWVRDLDDEQQVLRTGGHIGLPWRFCALRKFGVLRKKQVILAAARPGMGKSEFVFQLLYGIAKEAQALSLGCVVVCSLEMPREDVFDRWVAAIAGVPYSEIHERLTDDQIRRLNDAATSLRHLPIVINDKPSQSIQAIRRTVARAARKYGSVVAFGIDYVQLAEDDDPAAKKAARYEQIAKICKSAAAIAKDFECIAFLVAQLNRSCEARQDKRPMLSDLREGGDLEQVAHVALFIYRDDYYNPDSPDKHAAEIICHKNRSGGIKGTVTLGWKNGTFWDGVERHRDPLGWRPSREERDTEEFQ